MHCDMDAFFASIEQMDHPELRGKPVIVGGGGPRGVVSAASYEIRKYGVHSAMPLLKALHLCPHAIVVPVRMARYRELSHAVMQILQGYSPFVEQASVDEAYLDATGMERLFGPVETMARHIKRDIRKLCGLSCSIGLAPVKFLAKIASDMNKPDGLTILYPAMVPSFLNSLPVEKIPGVGKSTLNELRPLGVHTCADVLAYPRSFWERRLGKAGILLYDRSLGIDSRKIEPFTPPKSESAETTFETDTKDACFLRNWLFRHADRIGRNLRSRGLRGNVITLKIKYADFRTITRQTTLDAATCATETIYDIACKLLDMVKLENKVRLIGVGVSGFGTHPHQLLLPVADSHSHYETEARRLRLDAMLDKLQKNFGDRAIARGRLLSPQIKEPQVLPDSDEV